MKIDTRTDQSRYQRKAFGCFQEHAKNVIESYDSRDAMLINDIKVAITTPDTVAVTVVPALVTDFLRLMALTEPGKKSK